LRESRDGQRRSRHNARPALLNTLSLTRERILKRK